MRELKYAVLGLVNREPSTGYDIAKTFGDSVSNFWYAKHSQVYPELKRLVNEGLIEYRVVIHGEKLETKLYSITDEGKREFIEWLRSDEELGPVPKESFRLRLYFRENLVPQDLFALLTRQIDKHTVLLRELEKKHRSFHGIPDIKQPEFGDFLLILGAIAREKAYLSWLEECLDLTGCRSDTD